jgi:hypothetical protein
MSVSFHQCSIAWENGKKLITFITGLHNKPQGCGASVASAVGPFTTKKVTQCIRLQRGNQSSYSCRTACPLSDAGVETSNLAALRHVLDPRTDHRYRRQEKDLSPSLESNPGLAACSKLLLAELHRLRNNSFVTDGSAA